MGKVDFQGIADAALHNSLSLLGRWFPNGQLEGAEYRVGSLSGEAGQSLAINIHTGQWKDFSGDIKGADLINLRAAQLGIKQSDAAKQIAEELSMPGAATAANDNAKRAKKQRKRASAIMGVPPDAPAPSFRHWKFGEPTKVWPYPDGEGGVLFYVCRFDTEEGKEVVPRSWARREDGSTGWEWCGPRGDMLRPLYGLDRIAGKEPGTAIIVEGEKTADAAANLFPGVPVLTWPGGVPVALDARIDLTPLRGWKVVLWPDADHKPYPKSHPKAGEVMPYADQPGERAMVSIACALRGIAVGVRLVETPSPPPFDGWDLADALDEGWTSEKAREYIGAHLREINHQEPAAPEQQPDTETQDPTDMVEPPPEDEDHVATWPFRALGHNRGTFYYLSSGARQLIPLSAAAHTKLNLLQLASLNYWEREFPTKAGADWDRVANTLMQQCHRVGIFDVNRIRGRGCWHDGDHLIVHLGDRLMVDNELPMEPTAFKSSYIYEAAARMDGPGESPLSVAEARWVIDTAKRFNWEMPASAALVAGWIVLAPICGALSWRPHVWLSGGSGSGKTTVLEHFIAPLLAGTEIRCQGNSTEAGIRQTVSCDARPVIMDEAESNDERERNRIQSIIAMVRQASSESGARTLKGSAGGDATAFHVRSMFCLASINVSIDQEADFNRISVLTLRGGMVTASPEEQAVRQAHWLETERILADLRDRPDYANRLMSRAVRLLPVIKQNVRTLIRVAARKFGSQRLGDQYGTLLAGCAALWTDNVLTEMQAEDFISKFDWSRYTEEATTDDAGACLSSILQVQVRLETGVTLTLGELVTVDAGHKRLDPPVDVRSILGRYGIRFDGDYLHVANNADALSRALRDRPWATTWKGYLRRINGSKASGPMQFSPGHLARATSVPITCVFGGDG